MARWRSGAAVAAAVANTLSVSARALAQSPSAWTTSAEGGLASDYLFRGVDQTRGRGDGFAGVQLDGPGARFGLWASSVAVPGREGAATQAEVDLYGGWLTSVAGFDLDAGAIGYVFSGPRSRPDLLEPYARLARTLGPARLGVSAYAAPVGEHGARDAYGELNADYPLSPKWSVSGSVGHLHQNRATVLDAFAEAADRRGVDATTWTAALGYDLTERIGLELRWSDLDHRGPSYPSRVFATVRAKLF